MGLLAPGGGEEPASGGGGYPEFRGWGYHENCKSAIRDPNTGNRWVGEWKWVEPERFANAGKSGPIQGHGRWVCTECCATIIHHEGKVVESYHEIVWFDGPGIRRVLTIALMPAMDSGI
jgi:hypothetical protein